ncbi:hypothetical protein CAPTEDRAFT_203891 [Capitella teleta]|uniref:Uncharacterized protein n=1 Tax=Capitella teleta TaxID=283909 RepID=R7UP23_CAPTE|nr:hypothetical protein CAPTEDRAFT_203891 [Capitella teleta]|eukprot:ELU07863.1 hypothetical protein CAPTEDRAFT_203891 [Capitella teleta]
MAEHRCTHCAMMRTACRTHIAADDEDVCVRLTCDPNMGVAHPLILIGIITCVDWGCALDCLFCADLHLHQSNPFLQPLFADQTDSKCQNPDDATHRLSCLDSCQRFHGNITASSLHGKLSISATVRSCSISRTTEGCQAAEASSTDLMQLGQAQLTWVPGLTDLEFHGDICTCKSDGCLAECADYIFTLKLPLMNQSVCISWVMLCIAAISVLAFLSVIGACVWCCCCRKSNIHRDSLGRYVEKTEDKREIVILKK